MKQITKNTILKQGDKTYQPVEVDGIIYWVDKEENHWIGAFNINDKDVVVQSQPKLEGIPVIDLKTNLNYYNINQYTQKDIEKFYKHVKTHTFAEAMEQINSISLIEVDEQFNIISYE
jgi:predicted amino acid racemase